MSRLVRWCEVDLRVRTLHGVGYLVRHAEGIGEPLALPRLGRAIWDIALASNATVRGVSEVVASDVEILIRTTRVDVDVLLGQVREGLMDFQFPAPRRFRLPVWFDEGGDWEFVQQHTGVRRDEFIDRLLQCSFTLGMLGFLPGFAYLVGLPEALRCPRKETPATRVESGTVALGGDYLGVYSLPSPGGWHGVGRTPSRLFSMQQLPPLVLDVGDVLTIQRIDSREFAASEPARTLLEPERSP